GVSRAAVSLAVAAVGLVLGADNACDKVVAAGRSLVAVAAARRSGSARPVGGSERIAGAVRAAETAVGEKFGFHFGVIAGHLIVVASDERGYEDNQKDHRNHCEQNFLVPFHLTTFELLISYYKQARACSTLIII